MRIDRRNQRLRIAGALPVDFVINNDLIFNLDHGYRNVVRNGKCPFSSREWSCSCSARNAAPPSRARHFQGGHGQRPPLAAHAEGVRARWTPRGRKAGTRERWKPAGPRTARGSGRCATQRPECSRGYAQSVLHPATEPGDDLVLTRPTALRARCGVSVQPPRHSRPGKRLAPARGLPSICS